MDDMNNNARQLLESGDLSTFKLFLQDNKNDVKLSATFPDDENISFPMILVQTYRKMEATKTERAPMPVEDYLDCLRMMVKWGANINHQDELGRTVCHWAVLFKTKEILGLALDLNCDPMAQDSEGQTIVHLSVRLGCQVSLETIKSHAPSPEAFEKPSESSGATPLIYAVQIGSLETVMKLVQLSVDVNMQEDNKYKRTALHYALYTNRLDIFEVLIKAGSKPNIPDYNKKTVLERVAKYPNEQYLRLTALYSSGEVFTTTRDEATEQMTPLMAACQGGDASTVEQILSKGSDTDGIDEDLRTALHHCAEHRDTTCAKKLIERNNELVNKKDRNGFTALHLATISGNAPFMTLLLEYRADVDCLDNEGHTCLHWAVVCGQLEAIDLLIRQEASLSVPDVFGAHPLHYATQSFVNPDGDLKGPSVIHRLIQNKAPLDCEDKESRTPLLWASSLGVSECCAILLEAGASLRHQDKAGLSALHCAASRGQFEVVELLLDSWSMDIDCTDKNGCTPLFYAVTLNQTPIVELLLNRKSNPNHQDKRGRSPGHCAAVKGHLDILNLLRESGGSLWLKNDKEAYPLHEACESGNAEVVQFLLEKAIEDGETAKIAERNAADYTCLHLAAEAGSADICELLLTSGMDVNTITPGDAKVAKTPLDLAFNPDCKLILKEHGGLRAVDLLHAGEASGDLDGDSEVNTDDFNSVSDTETELHRQPVDQDAGTGQLSKCSSYVSVSKTDREGSVKSQASEVKSLPSSVRSSPQKRPPTAVAKRNGVEPGKQSSTPRVKIAVGSQRSSVPPPGRKTTSPRSQGSRSSTAESLPKVPPNKVQSKSATRGNLTREKTGQYLPPTSKKSTPSPRREGPKRTVAAGPIESYYALPPMTSRDSCASDDTSSAASMGSRGNGGRPLTTAGQSPSALPKKAKKGTIAYQIAESVRQFENVRSTMREMARIKRMQIYHGYLPDKGMMDALRSEYQRNYLYMQENDVNGDHTGNVRSDSSSETRDSPVQIKHRDSEKENDEDEKKLQVKIKETRELYKTVQRQADETLRNARKINAALCDDLQKKRIAAYASSKTLRTTTRGSDNRPITASLSENLRLDRIKKAYASPVKSDVGPVLKPSRPKTSGLNNAQSPSK